MTIDSFKLVGDVIYYSIFNLTDFPAQVLYINHSVNLDGREVFVRLKNGSYWNIPNHRRQFLFSKPRYTIKGIPIDSIKKSYLPEDRMTFNLNQPQTHDLSGKIYYESLVSQKMRVYSFHARVTFLNGVAIRKSFDISKNYSYKLSNAPIGFGAQNQIDPSQ